MRPDPLAEQIISDVLSLSGYALIPCKALAAVQERDTFSGGVNLSARERNRRRRCEERAIVDERARNIYASPWTIEKIKAAVPTEVRPHPNPAAPVFWNAYPKDVTDFLATLVGPRAR